MFRLHTVSLSLLSASLVLSGLAAQTPDQGPPKPDQNPPAPVEAEVVPTTGGGVEAFEEGGGNTWFKKTKRHLGTYFQEEEASGKFTFENPHPKAHKLYQIQPSCTCSKARITIGDRIYEIGSDKVLNQITKADGVETKKQIQEVPIGVGEKGEIQVWMKMDGAQGDKDADLQIMTSDSKLPVVNLRWRATGATYFVADPPEIHLNEMTWTDKREFTFTVYSPLREDFSIVRHDKLSKGMAIEYSKSKRDDGRAVWTISGTYGPGADERDNGGQIVLHTDFDEKTVTVPVSAFLKGPLEMKPGGFVSLGQVKNSEGKTVAIELTPNGDFDLQVEKVEVAQLNVKGEKREKLKFTQSKDGKVAKVSIVIEKGMAPGYVSGMLKIHTNHPAAKVKEVMFNAFVANR